MRKMLRALKRPFAALPLAFLFVAIAHPGMADVVTVRSGEHPGFSRLVLDLGSIPEWSLDGSGTSRRIDLIDRGVEFDTSGVFRRIGRGRIAGLDTGPGWLDLRLNCNCVVSADTLPGGRLVIDVVGAPRPVTRTASAAYSERNTNTGAGFAEPLVLSETLDADDAASPTGLAESSVASGNAVDDRFDRYWTPPPNLALSPELQNPFARELTRDHQLNRPTPGALPNLDADPGLNGLRDALDLLPLNAPGRPAPQSDRTDARRGPLPGGLPPFDELNRIGEASAALTNALERAAEQGLIDLPERAEEAVEPLPGHRRRLPLPLPLDEGSSLRVSTSLDRDLARLAGVLSDQAAGSGCLAGYDLDVGSWGTGDDPFFELGNARARIVGEFDLPDQGAALGLARSYIYLAFGAEARASLEAFDIPENGERAVLEFLASVADGEERDTDDPAARLLGCPNRAALWALLAVNPPPKQAEISKSNIVFSFSDLPLHLRRHFGPTLVDRFLSLDDPDTAREIWNAVDRAPGDHGESFVLASADLDLATGAQGSAEAGYRTLEAGSPLNAPKAVVRLLNTRLNRGATIDPGIVESAAALAFENRGTPLARDLKIAELNGRISLGQWDLTRNEIPRAQFAGALTEEDALELTLSLHGAIARRGSTRQVIRYGLEADARLPVNDAADPVRRALASRLLDLGLPTLSEGLLGQVTELSQADRVLFARADLALGLPEAAIGHLAAVEGPAGARLRGEALAQLGRLRAAAQAYLAAGDLDASQQTYLRAGEWRDAAGPVGQAAEEVIEDPPMGDDPGQLANKRHLIEVASGLRGDVARLLDATAETATN
ncbi:MAG: hypothetical protein AAF871_08265 [Pseudomonadota bacterium]